MMKVKKRKEAKDGKRTFVKGDIICGKSA